MTKETQKARAPRLMARELGTQSAPETDAKVDGIIADVADEKPDLSAAHKAPSKIDAVLALLRRPEGATLDEMTEATGWQKHTVRASLTGLKKTGHVIVRGKRGETTCYYAEGGA